MPYVQTLLDNFDDGSLDTSKWWETQGPGYSESGGTLNFACVADYPRLENKQSFDIRTGIFAAKLSTSGARTGNTEFYIGAHDFAGNHISGMGGPAGTYMTFQPGGLTTFNTEVIASGTGGIGPTWVPGTWWGIGNMDENNVIHMYKSSDGQNWSELGRCTVGGTYNKATTGFVMMAGVWDGSSPDLVAKFDDASFWSLESETFSTRKVRWGGNWVPATPKVRVGGAWVTSYPKPRIAGAWDSMI